MRVVFLVLTLIISTKVITKKTQCNAENACVNGMWQHGFKETNEILSDHEKYLLPQIEHNLQPFKTLWIFNNQTM